MRRLIWSVMVASLTARLWATTIVEIGPTPKFQPWFLTLDANNHVLADQKYDTTVQDSAQSKRWMLTGFSPMLDMGDESLLLVRRQWGGESNPVAYRVKTNGDVLQEFHTSCHGFCTAVCRRDSGFVFAGRLKGSGGGLWVYAVNTNGDSLWYHSCADKESFCLSGVQPTRDGVMLVTSRTDYSHGVVGSNLLEFVRANGEWREQRVLDVPGQYTDDCPAVARTADGGLLIATATISGNATWLVRTDGAGGVIWRKDSVDYGLQAAIRAADLSNGDFLLLGFTWASQNGRVQRIVRLRPDGERLWVRDYSGENSEDAFMSVAEADDGSLVVAGSTVSKTSRKQSALITRLSSDGNVLSRTIFEAPVACSFSSVLLKPDHSVLLIGGWAKERI